MVGTSCPFFWVRCHFLAGIARLAWGAGATGPICRARVLRTPGCGARRGRRAAFYPFCRLEARIIVVDPGFMVDPGYPSATCQVRKRLACAAADYRSDDPALTPAGVTAVPPYPPGTANSYNYKITRLTTRSPAAQTAAGRGSAQPGRGSRTPREGGPPAPPTRRQILRRHTDPGPPHRTVTVGQECHYPQVTSATCPAPSHQETTSRSAANSATTTTASTSTTTASSSSAAGSSTSRTRPSKPSRSRRAAE